MIGSINLFRHKAWYPIPKVRITSMYLSVMWGDVFFSWYYV